ncbi:methyltransferase DDB_G0268948 [Pelobates cultripes]|uniref:Methyltransferase DDB_G0268948 n=2 Tax=Pelobates cultripes TaxID=61616 RepID=A0AAD1SR46_PELCU|nr:methyltransferase DDB_G0268948 [Pelobates cultripes]
MATRLFEGKTHASYYQKYRFSPPQEVQDLIFNYMGERLSKPYGFAVDVGCGTGQSTRILVPYFEKILGTDISPAQIEEASKANDIPNVTYCVSPAEEVPVDECSVDLVTACAAAHWFSIEKFYKEVDRILKPRGCLAIFTYIPDMEVHYKDRSEQLTKVFKEGQKMLAPYENEKVRLVKTGYKDLFDAIPYTDKKRVENMTTKMPMLLSDFLGLIQTFSMFQDFLKHEPKKAKEFIVTTEKRFLEIMGVSSTETEIEVRLNNVCLLASKPK